MDENTTNIAIPHSSSVIPSKVTENNESMVEETRICPLCQSEVRLFFINFNEKLLMCENTKCEYPFGYEELQLVKENTEAQSDEEVLSFRSKPSCMSTTSIISQHAMSDIEKLNRICDAEDSQFDTRSVENLNIDKLNEKLLRRKEKEKIQKNIADIKELSTELTTLTEKKENVQIKNTKWIKNLKTLQEMSGMQLLKPEEFSLLRVSEPDLGSGELKIDIDPGNETIMSSIRIEILNKLDELNKPNLEDP